MFECMLVKFRWIYRCLEFCVEIYAFVSIEIYQTVNRIVIGILTLHNGTTIVEGTRILFPFLCHSIVLTNRI